MLKTEQTRIQGENETIKAVIALVKSSFYFQVEPWPFGEYVIYVKAEDKSHAVKAINIALSK